MNGCHKRHWEGMSVRPKSGILSDHQGLKIDCRLDQMHRHALLIDNSCNMYSSKVLRRDYQIQVVQELGTHEKRARDPWVQNMANPTGARVLAEPKIIFIFYNSVKQHQTFITPTTYFTPDTPLDLSAGCTPTALLNPLSSFSTPISTHSTPYSETVHPHGYCKCRRAHLVVTCFALAYQASGPATTFFLFSSLVAGSEVWLCY